MAFIMADATTYLLITICVFLLVFICKKITRGKKNYPPGPYGLPIVGHLLFYGKHPPATFHKWWRTYGDVFGVKLGSWDAVVVNGISKIKEVTHHAKDAFSGRPQFVSMELIKEQNGEELLGFGNFSPFYLKQQNFIARALKLLTSCNPDIIEELTSTEASKFVGQLLEKCGTVPGYLESDIQTLTVRCIYQLYYGRGKDVEIDQNMKVLANFLHEFDEFSSSGSPIDVMPWMRYIMPWKINEFRKLLSKYYGIQEVQVHEHHEIFSHDVIRDLADAMIAIDADDKSNKEDFSLTRTRLNNTLWDLLGAGFHTTNKVISWLMLYMTAYPEAQEKVNKEIEELVAGRKVSLKDRTSLPYTQAVILEVNRIVSVAPFALPHYAIMDAKIGDFDIDDGTVVILNLHSVHHDKEFWRDPENFRPERFLTSENTLDTDKCLHVLPYGIGRRSCLGESLAKMIIFMAFATIIQQCVLIKPPGEVLDLTPIPGIVYHPNDFRVLVKERL